MSTVADVALIRAAYESIDELRDFVMEAKVTKIIVDDGEGGTDLDKSPLAAVRADYVLRAIDALLEDNKTAIKSRAELEMATDLGQIETAANLP